MDRNALPVLYQNLAQGIHPPADGTIQIVPPARGAVAAVLAFTAHILIAADVTPEWLARHCPPGDLAAPLGPDLLGALQAETGVAAGCQDLVLVAQGEPGRLDLPLQPLPPTHPHPRVRRAHRYRADLRVFGAEGGLLLLGRGFAGRWEAAFEVEPQARNRGLGRALVVAARHLIPPGEALFMQVAAGNAASLRAVLAGGFTPVGAEVLFVP